MRLTDEQIQTMRQALEADGFDEDIIRATLATVERSRLVNFSFADTEPVGDSWTRQLRSTLPSLSTNL